MTQLQLSNVAVEFGGNVGDLDGLFAGDLAQKDWEANIEAAVLLGVDAEVIRGADGAWHFAEVLEPPPELFLNSGAHAIGAVVVDQELQARLGT